MRAETWGSGIPPMARFVAASRVNPNGVTEESHFCTELPWEEWHQSNMCRRIEGDRWVLTLVRQICYSDIILSKLIEPMMVDDVAERQLATGATVVEKRLPNSDAQRVLSVMWLTERSGADIALSLPRGGAASAAQDNRGDMTNEGPATAGPFSDLGTVGQLPPSPLASRVLPAGKESGSMMITVGGLERLC